MSEDLNPVVLPEEQPVEIQEEPQTEVDKTDFSNKGLKEIVDTFKELLDGENMQQLYKHAEALKAAFYKNLRKEKIASGLVQPAETAATGYIGKRLESAVEA